ncbi:hypothetical protein HRbin24_02108 [bacterium HR24]|mgnify:CR=1 FL=1|nr:hypothetical protein HRbin24_02108 [bacterium HR24]
MRPTFREAMGGNGDQDDLPEDWVLAQVPLEDFLKGLQDVDGVEEATEQLRELPPEEIEARLRHRKGARLLRSAGLDFTVRRLVGALRRPEVVVVVATALAIGLYRLSRRRRGREEGPPPAP